MAIKPRSEWSCRETIPPAVAAIINETCAKHGFQRGAIIKRSQGSSVHALCRQEICFRLRERGLSYPYIGGVIGRDHSSVSYAVKVYAKAAGVPVPPLVERGLEARHWDAAQARKAQRLWALGVHANVIGHRLNPKRSGPAVKRYAIEKGWGLHPSRSVAENEGGA